MDIEGEVVTYDDISGSLAYKCFLIPTVGVHRGKQLRRPDRPALFLLLKKYNLLENNI